MGAAEAKRITVEGTDMDAPETINGKRERAPVGGGDGLGYPHPIVG